MKCSKCGSETIYTMWNTERGDDEGWYCKSCDRFYPNYKARRSKQKEAENDEKV